jgi:ABC-2 type transport system ATP-binding protein
MSQPVVEIVSLSKVFDGRVRAVDGISLSLGEGEIFGLLGPNGAGKSTTIKILVTLLKPDSGSVRVLGHDVASDPDAVRSVLGYVPQEVALDRLMSGRQNLELLANLYHLPPADVPRRVQELLEMVELTDRAEDPVKGYSGGMKKRLDIAGGLLHRPRLLVLDEPTLGLDIQTRVRVWETIRKMRAEGTTVLITTHYMEEADQLCDRIGIIDHGKIQALGTPAELKAALAGDSIELTLAGGAPAQPLIDEVARLEGVTRTALRETALRVWVKGEAALAPLLTHLTARGQKVERLTYTRPTLDEVFLQYTGRSLRD